MYSDICCDFPPHALIKQNLAIWQMSTWNYYSIDYIEPIPASSQTIVDLGAVNANTNTALTELTNFDIDTHQLMQLRWWPLDDIEGQLWLTRSQGKFATRGLQSRVTKATRAWDPTLQTTEFNVLGRDRNPFIAAYNLSSYNLAASRFILWGRKYIMIPLRNVVEQIDDSGVMRAYVNTRGGLQPLNCCWIDAEGRLA